MDYNRRDFLRFAAAGLPVAATSWFFPGAAHARAGTRGSYTQARADRIHSRSTEEAIRRAGDDPEEVKARVDRRLRELRADSIR
jgi:hypothetical protein